MAIVAGSVAGGGEKITISLTSKTRRMKRDRELYKMDVITEPTSLDCGPIPQEEALKILGPMYLRKPRFLLFGCLG